LRGGAMNRNYLVGKPCKASPFKRHNLVMQNYYFISKLQNKKVVEDGN